MQSTRVFWGSVHGTVLDEAHYCKWFARHVKCIPTTLNICLPSANVFLDNKEMKELCGTYMPFPSIVLPQDQTRWHWLFDFKTEFLLNDYFDLLKKIREDEKNLENNQDRIQKIYSNMLKHIDSWSSKEQILIKTQAKTLYFLTENNQWKLAYDLYLYVEGSGENNNLNDAIPSLKLDFKNKNHPQLNKFLQFFNIKQIQMNDLMLIDKDSSSADQFREKLIQISPFIKKWLKKLAFQSDIISSIDQILQQKIDFIESDCLELYYNGNLVQETNVYFDTIRQQFYIIRPWNSETTLMDLPNKLCQLLDIQKFEDKLRFLLKAQMKEIIKHFTKLLIEIPTNKDIVSLNTLPRSEILERIKSSTVLLPESKESTSSIKDKEISSEESSCDSADMEIYHDNPQNQKYANSSSVDIKRKFKASTRRRHLPYSEFTQLQIEEMSTSLHSFRRSFSSGSIDSNDEDFDNIEVIDISSISTSSSKTLKTSFDRSGGNDGLDLYTGSMGENIVYEYLQKKYSSQSNSILIKWENQNGESHLPYDILLIENQIKHYIEVKSTRTNNQHSFQLSINQIESILQHKENYFIYRVYLDEKKLIILDNIRCRLKYKQQLACFLTIKPLLLE